MHTARTVAYTACYPAVILKSPLSWEGLKFKKIGRTRPADDFLRAVDYLNYGTSKVTSNTILEL